MAEKKDKKADVQDKLLDDTLLAIEKQFGKGSIMKLGDHDFGRSRCD